MLNFQHKGLQNFKKDNFNLNVCEPMTYCLQIPAASSRSPEYQAGGNPDKVGVRLH